MFIQILTFLLISTSLISTEPIVLTDKTWTDVLKGQWMVEFYAPWCPACQQFKSTWNDFSKMMAPKNVKVAAIDVEQYPSLSGRFRISALPTIYHVDDGVFRHFTGERSLRGMRRYIEDKEWEKTEPISTYFGPNSILMSIASAFFDISILVKNTHALLQDYYGWPSWVIYTIFAVGVVTVGTLLGFGCLQMIDYCLGGLSKTYTTAVPDDIDELDEGDSQKYIESTKEILDESQEDDDEVLQSYSTDDDAQDNDDVDDEQPITTDQTLRQRR